MGGRQMRKITYKGIRTHNLKNIDIEVSKDGMTCIAGTSGSGKSSLAFSTIAAVGKAEYDKMTNDNHVATDYELDSYDDVLMTIPLKQLNFNVNPRSTIMSYFDLQKFIVYIASSCTGKEFSNFNYNGAGRCPDCNGLGTRKIPDATIIIDYDKKIKDIPFKCWNNTYSDFFKQLLIFYCKEKKIDVDSKFENLSKDEQQELLYGIGNNKYTIKYKANSRQRTKTSVYIGAMKGLEKTSDLVFSSGYENFSVERKCPTCKGCRLNNDVSSLELSNGFTVSDLYTKDFLSIESELKKLGITTGNSLKNAYLTILSFIDACKKVDLGYLNLTRSISSLSGGELQRLRIAQLLVGKMHGLMLVLDEPTASLYPSEVEHIIDLMDELKNKNTLLVVEHNEKILEKSDHKIFLGHDGGRNGGYLISEQEYIENQKYNLPYRFFKARKFVKCLLNSDYVDYNEAELYVPISSLLGICGESGSGKTTILKGILPKYFDNYEYVSQKPLKGNSFTTVGTYTKIFDEIRAKYAKVLRKDRSYFTSRGKGACKTCGGTGCVEIGNFYEEKVYDICEKCNGTGYRQEVMNWKINGLNVYEMQQMCIDDIISDGIKISAKADKALQLLSNLGLGYLKLNQQIKTLSGGENQRIKLAQALNDNKKSIIGLDEPVKGLGKKEIAKLLTVIFEQIEKTGKTFIISEHDTMFLSYCSYLVELQRKNGKTNILFQGLREHIFSDKKSDMKKWLIKME